MTWLLNSILCVLTKILGTILWAIMTALNNIILTLATLLAAAIDLLPTMPAGPDWSDVEESVFGYAAWIFPIGFLVEILASLGTLMLAWWAVQIIIRKLM